MAKLTLHTRGGQEAKSAEFLPPSSPPLGRPRSDQTRGLPEIRLPITALLGAALLGVVFFVTLVVLMVLLAGERREVAALQQALDARQSAEVTRTGVDLLSAPDAQQVPDMPRDVVASARQSQLATPPLPEVQSRQGCAEYLRAVVPTLRVRFPVGSNDPDPQDMASVRDMLATLRICPEVKLVVEGHSERHGSDKLNMDLSWYRAQTVIDLLRRDGADTSQLEPLGFGATEPINVSGTITGEAENRRVQFRLLPRNAVVDARLIRP